MKDKDTEEWRVITKKDKKRVFQGTRRGKPAATRTAIVTAINRRHPATNGNNLPESVFSDTDKERCKTEIQCCVEKLRVTDFYRNLREGLTNVVVMPLKTDEDGHGSLRDMVCYGVGNFSTASASLWQFACILSLQADLAVEHVFFYDPCTTDLEVALLKEFQIQIIPDNERGHRPVSVPTLFYMPHCPQQLYANVLMSNWETLNNVIFFGNSLQAYESRHIGNAALHKSIEVLLPFLREEELKYSKLDLEQHYPIETAFNDCNLVQVQGYNWEGGLPPIDDATDQEVL